MNKGRKPGFVLIELLPALFLLLAVLVVTGRLVRTATETRLAAERLSLREAAVEAVWNDWNGNGGSVLVAYRGAGGKWEHNRFPDSGWIPSEAARAATMQEGVKGMVVILKREPVTPANGDAYWSVSRLVSGAGGGQWKEWGRIRMTAGGEVE